MQDEIVQDGNKDAFHSLTSEEKPHHFCHGHTGHLGPMWEGLSKDVNIKGEGSLVAILNLASPLSTGLAFVWRITLRRTLVQ